MLAKHKGFASDVIVTAVFVIAAVSVFLPVKLPDFIQMGKPAVKTVKKLTQMQLAMMLIKEDIKEITHHPITMANKVSPVNTANVFSFKDHNNQLVHLDWSVLDKPPYVEPSRSLFKNGVTEKSLVFVNERNQIINNSTLGIAPMGLLRGSVMLTLTFSQK